MFGTAVLCLTCQVASLGMRWRGADCDTDDLLAALEHRHKLRCCLRDACLTGDMPSAPSTAMNTCNAEEEQLTMEQAAVERLNRKCGIRHTHGSEECTQLPGPLVSILILVGHSRKGRCKNFCESFEMQTPGAWMCLRRRCASASADSRGSNR